MFRKLRNRHFFFLDAILLAATPFIALSLRVSIPWSAEYLPTLGIYTLIALFIKLPVFYVFGLYKRFWPFASIDAMLSIIMGVILASVLVTVVFFSLGGLDLPRSIPFIDAMLTLILVGGSRFSVRLLKYAPTFHPKNGDSHRVLIAGAGEAGQTVAREIRASDYVTMNLVGFVDDDHLKIGATIHGAPVLGSLDRIPEIVESYLIKEIIIAMPTASGDVIRRVVKAAEAAGIPSRTLPGIYEMLSGQVSISRLREVEINDLLRREPVHIDPIQVHRLLLGKCVLVTGAGGSIGTELCLQIATCQPSRLIALGHGENSLHTLKFKFKDAGIQDCQIDFIVADVRDRDRLETIFARHQPHVVFHAAAHKHVPLMEANLEDAVTNNILGTWNLVQVAQKYSVDRFVLISTDKAVQPVNIMGMTKRVAELIVRLAASQSGRPYVCVRFGNVLGSRGSVIPLFKRQIASGGPVTITHPDMERYFMTVPEAVQLVLQASALGENGEVFVLDMGKPIKISDLAHDMIELSGYQLGRDIQIQYTGVRPGERLSEPLFSPNETSSRTRHEKIMIAQNGLNPSFASLPSDIDALGELAKAGRTTELRQKLEQLASENFYLPTQSHAISIIEIPKDP